MATALVTGSNRGIGLELCLQLRDRGDDVIACCRVASPTLSRLGVRVEEGVDVTDQKSVDDLAMRVAGIRIDLLINNAGVLSRESVDDMDFARMRRQFEINALGPMRVTVALLPNLVRGSKIAILTSRMGSIGDNSSGGRYGYRMSKAAVNIAGVSLAHDLKARGIAVAILHPGFVRTDMTDHEGMVDPPESAHGLLARIDELTLETSGGFWHANGERLPW
ncbi:MAG: SDR family oxidoreductase [Polyangiaceae bacterium]|jgi:NAD(P)-dependent dehydrogenase (short-subunit alcohol dehydrogenase family)|nr:SDR family oxidoreductase [Polyangiaceae bacterium]